MSDEEKDIENLPATTEAPNEMQEKFCREYLVDFNGTKAAIRAGYAEASAHVQASRLLKNDKVATRLAELRDAKYKRLDIKGDDILRALHEIGMSDIADMFDPENGRVLDIREMPVGLRRAIRSIEVEEIWQGYGEDREIIGRMKKITFWDKPKSLELLGKNQKLFNENADSRDQVKLEDLVAGSMKPEEKK
jgi:phage terminase small subunit